MKKRLLAFSLALLLGGTSLAGCGSQGDSSEEMASITYFGVNANSGSGELTGGLGKFFEDR